MTGDDSTVQEYERRAEEYEHSPLLVLLKIAVGCGVGRLRLRPRHRGPADDRLCSLQLAGANPDASFVEWVYRSTGNGPCARSAASSRPRTSMARRCSTCPILVAAIVYLVIALLVDGVHRWLTVRLRRQAGEAGRAARAGRHGRPALRRATVRRGSGGPAGGRPRVRRPASRGTAVRHRSRRRAGSPLPAETSRGIGGTRTPEVCPCDNAASPTTWGLATYLAPAGTQQFSTSRRTFARRGEIPTGHRCGCGPVALP